MYRQLYRQPRQAQWPNIRLNYSQRQGRRHDESDVEIAWNDMENAYNSFVMSLQVLGRRILGSLPIDKGLV